MGLLSFLQNTPASAALQGDGVTLRAPRMEDFKSWRELRLQSRTFLEPWEPAWSDSELLRSSFRLRLRRYEALMESDEAYAFFIFASASEDLLGGITLSNVRRGVSQSATLGYWMGEVHANQGHMTKALTALLAFAFTDINLHRVEAACLPRNFASIKLLERSGFRREGYAAAYLKIADQWEDHLLWAKLTPEKSHKQ